MYRASVRLPNGAMIIGENTDRELAIETAVSWLPPRDMLWTAMRLVCIAEDENGVWIDSQRVGGMKVQVMMELEKA